LLGSLNGYGFLLTPDGTVLAILGPEGEIDLYDASTRAHLGLLGRAPGTQDAAFSLSGTRLAVAYERDTVVRLWDVPGRRLLRELGGHYDGVFAVLFTPDDRAIVSAGEDGTIRFWDAASGTPLGAHEGHSGRIWGLALSPDGKTLASAGRDGTVRLWEPEPPRALPGLPGGTHARNFSFTRDGRNSMTLEDGPPRRVSRRDAATGEILGWTPIDLPDSFAWTAFSPDGETLAGVSQERKFCFWSTATGRLRDTLNFEVQEGTPVFSPDGRFVALALTLSKWALWDREGRRLVPAPRDKGFFSGFAPSGDALVVDPDGTFHWWDPGGGHIRTPSPRPIYYTGVAAVSPDSRVLATAESSTHKLHLWTAETLEPRHEMPGHAIGVASLAFSPDGKTLASAGWDRTLRPWDVSTGEELLAFEGFAGTVCQPRFSSNGKSLAVLDLGRPGGHYEVIFWRASRVEPAEARPPEKALAVR
jgi:WD40 repeat protein